jgi:hypothetical protein
MYCGSPCSQLASTGRGKRTPASWPNDSTKWETNSWSNADALHDLVSDTAGKCAEAFLVWCWCGLEALPVSAPESPGEVVPDCRCTKNAPVRGPGQSRPLLVHFWHCGNASSHCGNVELERSLCVNGIRSPYFDLSAAAVGTSSASAGNINHAA